MSKSEIEKRLEECKKQYAYCYEMIYEQKSEDGHEIDIMEALDYEMQHLNYLLEKAA